LLLGWLIVVIVKNRSPGSKIDWFFVLWPKLKKPTSVNQPVSRVIHDGFSLAINRFSYRIVNLAYDCERERETVRFMRERDKVECLCFAPSLLNIYFLIPIMFIFSYSCP
jgi:hypothetical protein